MQVYKAPLKDYKFLIKDFLNLGSSDLISNNYDIEQSDLEMILEQAAKLCEEKKLQTCILRDLRHLLKITNL